ncbi:MAG TPA: choice-of-anchor tandem repeat GloVer-containing protein [Terracidiphilus sp.]|nr:choice-of-anchor tandem repeat GloVer-containing protein [Terracidiphilus sp.]
MKTNWLKILSLVGAIAASVHAQSYKVLNNFTSYRPGEPWGIFAQSRGGYLLTSAPDDEKGLHGDVFRLTTSGIRTVLHEFATSDGGRSPIGGVTLGKDGRFYGTTESGGIYDRGTIFEMTPDGTVKTLYDFEGADGSQAESPPIRGLNADFYGVTSGYDDSGTIYRITPGGSFLSLHLFTGTDGAKPLGTLLQAINYWFYGTTSSGGTSDVGTLFRISPSGQFELLFSFDGKHGAFPEAGLIQASDGNFYGVTPSGGTNGIGWGVVYKMTSTRQVTVLHNFTNGSDGAAPVGALVQATDGYLYGTTVAGGAFGTGVLFRISTTGEFKVLHDFQPSTGVYPVALIQHTNGFLYGITKDGGVYGDGVFYRFDLGVSPFITYLPSYGRVGMTVDILGEGFTTDSKVFFNGVSAQIITVEPTYMRVVVPAGATSGSIRATTTKGILKSNKVFLVRP